MMIQIKQTKVYNAPRDIIFNEKMMRAILEVNTLIDTLLSKNKNVKEP